MGHGGSGPGAVRLAQGAAHPVRWGGAGRRPVAAVGGSGSCPGGMGGDLSPGQALLERPVPAAPGANSPGISGHLVPGGAGLAAGSRPGGPVRRPRRALAGGTAQGGGAAAAVPGGPAGAGGAPERPERPGLLPQPGAGSGALPRRVPGRAAGPQGYGPGILAGAPLSGGHAPPAQGGPGAIAPVSTDNPVTRMGGGRW